LLIAHCSLLGNEIACLQTEKINSNKYHPSLSHSPLKRSHKGCICDEGFEGDFCEYKVGEAPTIKPSSGSGVGTVLGILTVIVVSVVGAAFWKRKMAKKKLGNTVELPPVGELKADASDII